MRLYRCLSCTCGFAVFFTKRGKNNAGGKGITCPLCKAEKVEEVDAIAEVGANLARRVWDMWRSLPHGDD